MKDLSVHEVAEWLKARGFVTAETQLWQDARKFGSRGGRSMEEQQQERFSERQYQEGGGSMQVAGASVAGYNMTTPAMSPRVSPYTGRHPVSPTSTGGYESQEEEGMGFRRVPLLNDVGKSLAGSSSFIKKGQKHGEDSWSSQCPPSSPSGQSICKSTSTNAQMLHSRNESFELPPIPGMGGLKTQGKDSSPHQRPSTAPLIVTAAVSPLEMNENRLRRKSADFVSGNSSRHHRNHPQSQSLDWSNHNSYFGTAQWVFGQNNSGNSEVYKSFVNFLDQNSPRTKQGCEENDTVSHDETGREAELDVVDDLVVPPAPKSLETGTKSIVHRKDELIDALGSLHLASGDVGQDKTLLGRSLANSLSAEREEPGRTSLQLDSPFASVSEVGVNAMDESTRTGSSDVFSFPVKSCQVETQETVAPLFGVGSWPSFHTANASQSPSCHNVEYYSTDEDEITEVRSNVNSFKGKSGIAIPGQKAVNVAGCQEPLVPVGSPNPIKFTMHEEAFDPMLYSYDDGYITSEYEEIVLTVLHRRGGTGFEYLRELPLKTNDLIAGRYQIADFLGQAAFSRAVQALDLKTGQYVCLKVVKNDKDYFDQSLDEIKVLRYVNACDPGDHYRIVRLLDYLYFKEHLILVTELLRANLYEFSKYDSASQEDTYFIPTRLKAMAMQMLEAVCFLHSLSLIHADLKPENILIKSYSQCEIKLIDLGSAFFDSDPRASFVQSWSYRAPEVILGLPYSFSIDIWSVGCILVELAVGRVLFRETTCPQMLASMESVLGPFPPALTLDGKYSKKYFLSDGRIFENNPETGGVDILQPRISSLASVLDSFDPTMVDFVEKLLTLDPEKSLVSCAKPENVMNRITLGESAFFPKAAFRMPTGSLQRPGRRLGLFVRAAQVSSNDFKTGMSIEFDGQPYKVVEFLHVKPGKGAAFVRSKLKNFLTGNTVERTWRAGESVELANVDKKDSQFTYTDGEEYVFMDMSTYEETRIPKDDTWAKYLKEGMDVSVLVWNDKVISVDLPNTVELEVVETDPGVKGNTAQGGSKPATLETGAIIQVPLFIQQGEKIKVDTRSDEYLSRAN